MVVFKKGYGWIQANAIFFRGRVETEYARYELDSDYNHDKIDFRYQTFAESRSWEKVDATFFANEEQGIKSISSSLTTIYGVFNTNFNFEEENRLEEMSLEIRIPYKDNTTEVLILSWNVSGTIKLNRIIEYHKYNLKSIATLSEDEVGAILITLYEITGDNLYETNLVESFSLLFMQVLAILEGENPKVVSDTINEIYKGIKPKFYEFLDDVVNNLLEKMKKQYNENSDVNMYFGDNTLDTYFDNNLVLSRIRQKVIESKKMDNILYLTPLSKE